MWVKFYLFLLCFLSVSLLADNGVLTEPYGLCAHPTRKIQANVVGDYEIAAELFDEMKGCNVKWLRTDFDWWLIEPKKDGNRNFQLIDDIVELAKTRNIGILPIIGDAVSWRQPGLWQKFTEIMVSRYKDCLPYWEVYNEPNAAGFWGGKPDPVAYGQLLVSTAKVIHGVNPDLKVVYGGLAAPIPLDFIKKSFQVGAADAMDVMNLHAYHRLPEYNLEPLRKVRQLMAEHNVAQKPLWITEVGWPTPAPTLFRNALPACLERLNLKPEKITCVVFDDPNNGYGGSELYSKELKCFKNLLPIRMEKLKSLDVKRYPVLSLAFHEGFPVKYIDDLLAYLRRGGTVISPCGCPFYFEISMEEGKSKWRSVGGKYWNRFHIGVDLPWENKSLPAKVEMQYPASGFADKFTVDFLPARTRFLNDKNLHPGDSLISVVESKSGSFHAPVLGIYRFNSELKGNIIAYTGTEWNEGVSEEAQALYLPRTYLIAYSVGVEKVFWYNLYAREKRSAEREDHFGIIHSDLSPKPAYIALKTLTEMLPSGSTVPELSVHNGVYLAKWTRPDKENVFAIWAIQSTEVALEINGDVKNVFSHMGEKLNLAETTSWAKPSVTYFVGPHDVKITF